MWGAHEGSLLLWALILALWTGAVARVLARAARRRDRARARRDGHGRVGFLAFLIFTSNPFERLLPAAAEGRDLNPLLQDPGMIIHPPMLYIGYVGFRRCRSRSRSRRCSTARVDARWLRWTRPWTNVAWAFLTLGIALGSWWAYYELGWGGWWFWDPVENAQLHAVARRRRAAAFAGGDREARQLPRLDAAAGDRHVLAVAAGHVPGALGRADRRCTRSPSDPARGLFILIFLGIVIGGSLLLYALRAPRRRRAAQPFAAVSRETLLLANNLLLSTACAMVLLGTLYPLLADALELGKISVGPPYFGLLFVLLMAPLVLLLPFGPLTRWQREQRVASRWRCCCRGRASRSSLVASCCFCAPQAPWKVAAGVLGAAWVHRSARVALRAARARSQRDAARCASPPKCSA